MESRTRVGEHSKRVQVVDHQVGPIGPIVELRGVGESPRTEAMRLSGNEPQIPQLDSLQIRQELARELHDQVAQTLTSVLVQTRIFARANPHDREAVGQFAYVHSSVLEVLNNVRKILSDLRGQPLLDGDVACAVREGLLPRFSRTRMRVTLLVGRAWPECLPPETGIHLYRIIQEALTNAYRHGGARSAEVHLKATANLLMCTIRDDGRGIACVHDAKPIGMGILGMKERAAILGGMLTVRNRPRGGTTVTASFAKEGFLWESTQKLSAS
jgi:two-component system sensor histidine kinase UhpB